MTPAMTAAGVAAYDAWLMTADSEDAMVTAVYNAMVSASVAVVPVITPVDIGGRAPVIAPVVVVPANPGGYSDRQVLSFIGRDRSNVQDA